MAKKNELVKMNMNQALTRLSGAGTQMQLSEVDEVFALEGSSEEDAYDFVPSKIKVALGGVKGFSTADGTPVSAPLVGFVLSSAKIRGYWPRKSGTKVPFCSSLGGRWGVVNLDYQPEDLGAASDAATPHPHVIELDSGKELSEAYSCKQCPLSQFGSQHESQGGSGRGQACKKRTRLLFLPEGWAKPAVVTLPTMSVAKWDEFCSTLETQYKRPYYGFKIALDVEPSQNKSGDPFGMVVPRFVSMVEDKEDAVAIVTIREQMSEYIRSQAIVVDEGDS
jgi:hypothetical protein